MVEYVYFAPESVFREKAEKVFAKHRKLILKRLPQSEVHYIGSTAVKGSLTKGDVDLQVRIDQQDFPEAKKVLQEIYAINEGSYQTSFFCAFETEDQLPIGVQLTVNGSEVDHFWKTTRFLQENPSCNEAYNQLKRQFNGKDMENYRDAKAEFLAEVLASEAYQNFLLR
ncbi:GrpB family protein [Virgibacillus senegalensis]|uniref:GrpB family protein n=1 Tax=Virgibacillus senegalensis TaxID=1499679 RepID=UPI00069F46CD|nr:GrpB family protein [Virgibacillus senegalensis]